MDCIVHRPRYMMHQCIHNAILSIMHSIHDSHFHISRLSLFSVLLRNALFASHSPHPVVFALVAIALQLIWQNKFLSSIKYAQLYHYRIHIFILNVSWEVEHCIDKSQCKANIGYECHEVVSIELLI